MSDSATRSVEKWTEIEHLPEWDEEFYQVYTAKKYGKRLMLKALKPELRDQQEYRNLIEKEFDIRYNLAHPHIVMINDFEEVPGLGMCIITDNIHGDSLQTLIDNKQVDEDVIKKVTNQLVEALQYIQSNHIVHHPLTAERVIFTDNIHNLKLIDVGFDQKNHLTPADAAEDIYNFGVILNKTLDAAPSRHPELRRVAVKCMAKDPARRYRDIEALKSALNNYNKNRLYITIIIFLAIMVIVLAWINSPWAPAPPEEVQNQERHIDLSFKHRAPDTSIKKIF